MYKTTDFRGAAREAMRITNIQGNRLFDSIKTDLAKDLKARGIPASVTVDEVKSGGFFGTTAPMLIIKHSNPPTRFFDIGIVVNENVVSFPLLGQSEQNTKLNKLEDLKQRGKFMQSMLYQPDEFILQQEQIWQQDVISVIEQLFTAN